MSSTEIVGELWAEIVARVNQDERFGRSDLAFLALAEPKGILGDTLYIEVKSDLSRNKIEQDLRGAIIEALTRVGDNQGAIHIAVTVNPNLAMPAADPEPIVEPTNFRPTTTDVREPAPADNPLNPAHTFDNFVTGNSNRMAMAAAFAVARAPGRSYNPLFIHGASGLGKTHLLHAIGNSVRSEYPTLRVRYVSSEEFTNDFINSLRDNRPAAFQAEYRQVDVLLIDDIQFLADKEQTQEAFFYTFEALNKYNKQIVLTSDQPPTRLSGFEDRLTSRFAKGLSADVQAPELETRIAILRKKAEYDKADVPEDVLDYIAKRVSSNVREIEGVLNGLLAYSSLHRRPIDMATAQTVLKDYSPLGQDTIITASEIIAQVAKYYNVSVDDIHGKNRTSAIANARQIAMYLCRTMTDLSLPKIGQILGDRDHTTVLYGHGKIAQEMKHRRAIYNDVIQIEDRIKATR
ncbi:MAG: chromosomal replication initiator protein DnaA [Micrococcales bacterium]